MKRAIIIVFSIALMIIPMFVWATNDSVNIQKDNAQAEKKVEVVEVDPEGTKDSKNQGNIVEQECQIVAETEQSDNSRLVKNPNPKQQKSQNTILVIIVGILIVALVLIIVKKRQRR